MFDSALEAEPGCERNAPHELFGYSSEIERDQAEAAALQDEVGGFENLLEPVLVMLVSSFEAVNCRLLVVGKSDVRRTSFVVRKVKILTFRKERGRLGHPVSYFFCSRPTTDDRRLIFSRRRTTYDVRWIFLPTSHPKQPAEINSR